MTVFKDLPIGELFRFADVTRWEDGEVFKKTTSLSYVGANNPGIHGDSDAGMQVEIVGKSQEMPYSREAEIMREVSSIARKLPDKLRKELGITILAELYVEGLEFLAKEMSGSDDDEKLDAAGMHEANLDGGDFSGEWQDPIIEKAEEILQLKAEQKG